MSQNPPKTLADLYENDLCWIKGTFALDTYMHQTHPRMDEAVCWCLTGGVIKVYGEYTHMAGVTYAKLDRVIRSMFSERIAAGLPLSSSSRVVVFFNDHPATTFNDILAVVKAAGV